MRMILTMILTTLLVLPFVSTAAASATVENNMKSFTDPATNMEFVLVKGGCFPMGDTFGDGEKNEQPVHQVCVDDFYMGRYEVSVGEFRKFVSAANYRTEAERRDGCAAWIAGKWVMDKSRNWRDPGFPQDDSHPVVCMSWNDARAYADWMSGTGSRYRLPTEAEWEYAAKSGGRDEKWSGTSDESEVGGYAWSKENAGDQTQPAGRKKPNGLGLYDMSGNVFEWVGDWHSVDYYRDSPKDNPAGPSSGEEKALRGGSWDNRLKNIRTATRRRSSDPASRLTSDGFRLVMPVRQ
ncbi:MAG TPA: hypothetical protein DDY32_11050 [Desulfobulbaceae bacterium]|nr:hypothetical protein [Desulfobulbaceae bacterium]